MASAADPDKPLNIISASRRTDIPAFYTPWLLGRLREGYARYPNPFNRDIHTVSLRADEVHSIVFWSKHYGPLLPHLADLTEAGYRCYFHYTITGAPRLLEPHVPDWRRSADVFRELASRTSARHVQWRFDPILFAGELEADFYLARFRDLAEALKGSTHRCYFSFADFYGKVKRRMGAADLEYRDPSLEEREALVEAMADIADSCGIRLYACCEEALAQGRVARSRCIDGDLLAELFPDRPLVSETRPTRKECGCMVSRDIGMYDSCPYGCVYCYANRSHEAAVAHLGRHEPGGDMLVPREQRTTSSPGMPTLNLAESGDE